LVSRSAGEFGSKIGSNLTALANQPHADRFPRRDWERGSLG